MRRDANNLYNNDHFGVSFDSFYDRRNGYGFAVNPQGGMLDWSITNEQPNNDWNGVWDVKTGTFDDGWTVEIRFPFRSFRFRENGHIWGMNFRPQGHLQERGVVPDSVAGRVGQAGHVEDVGGSNRHRHRGAGKGKQSRHQAVRARVAC